MLHAIFFFCGCTSMRRCASLRLATNLTGTSRARVALKFMLPYGLGRIQVILMVAVELLMYAEAVAEITFVLVLQGEHPH